jgi:hypothetical protein
MENAYIAYLDNESNYHLIGAASMVGCWDFEKEESLNPNVVIEEGRVNSFEEAFVFLNLAEGWFGQLSYTIEITNKVINTKVESKYLHKAKTIDEISSIVLGYLETGGINLNALIDFKIKCFGECVISETTSISNAFLFELWINTFSRESICVATQNLCFTPYNHLTRTKQFEIWKNNAPKLAKLVYEFSKISKLTLTTEMGELFPCGNICIENVYYLVCRPFSSPEGEIWEEWIPPFELLNEEDYIFGQITNGNR